MPVLMLLLLMPIQIVDLRVGSLHVGSPCGFSVWVLRQCQ
jgi:hypothetical protein